MKENIAWVFEHTNNNEKIIYRNFQMKTWKQGKKEEREIS